MNEESAEKEHSVRLLFGRVRIVILECFTVLPDPIPARCFTRPAVQADMVTAPTPPEDEGTAASEGGGSEKKKGKEGGAN